MTIHVGGATRRAIVVNSAPTGERRPAVIVLHGGMGSAEDMRARSGFDQLSRAEGFVVAYGEGTEFRDGMHAWNTGYLLRRQVRGADDIAYLDALIDRLVTDHGADPARIFMTGGSNGGMMTFAYAVQRAQRLAAAAPVVASMFSFDAVPSTPLPILVINGAKDDEVPLAGGMSKNPIVSQAQAAPFKPVHEVVDFWVKANASETDGKTVIDGTLTTVTYAAGPGGAMTEFIYSYVALCDLPDGVAGVFGQADEAEDIRGQLVPFDRLMAAVAGGEIANAPLILTALWLQRERDRLRGVTELRNG